MKKTISIAICVLLMLSVMPMSVFAGEFVLEPLISPKIELSNNASTSSSELSLDADSLIERLRQGGIAYSTAIDISDFHILYNNEGLQSIFDYIYYEIPELFHINECENSTYYYENGKYYFKTIEPRYRFTASEYPTMLAEMKSAADKLLAGVKGNKNLTDVEKALILHDRLAVWSEYDVEFTTGEKMYTAYGILANQIGVCMGYALAYDYLLEQVGIDSRYCSSATLNHAWNIVVIDGVEYHVDVTHDDPTYDKTGYVSHINFLRSTEGIKSTTHNATDFIATPSDTRYDNYYWQNSETAFQLIGDDIYYLDTVSATINKLTDNGSEVLVNNLETMWFIGNSYSYYPGCYSKLTSDGIDLYFSNRKTISKYDVSAGTVSTALDLSSSQYEIYGFKWENCKFICDMNDSPNFSITTKTDRGSQTTHHADVEWVIDKFATSGSNGATHRTCLCGERQTGTTSTKATSLPLSSGVTTDGNLTSIFTADYLIDDISEIINTTPESVKASHTAGNKSFYGTGTEITVNVTDSEKVSLTLIVDGDLNGDSVCDVLDVQLTGIYSNGLEEATENEILAANGGNATEITTMQYRNIVNKALR